MDVDEIVEGITEKTGSGGNINYIQLIQKLGLVGKIGGILIGIIIIVILTIVPIIVSLEIMYIVFPTMREKTDELIIKVENSGIASKVVGITFRDAKKAVEQANTVMIGEKSALAIYLGIKIKSIMFIVFVIALVILGAPTIINFVYKIISGILNKIK